MNKQAAEKMSRDLIGKSIGGWGIQSYINHGKSAVVFWAEKAGQQAALKVFDPDIVERYGRDNQLKRIERERSLIGKSHPNLISIYGGGEDNGLLYIAMEYFRGANLEEKLLEIPKSEIRSLTAQIASAAKFLEECSFAHRDIKPANIGISDDLKFAKLLDFGVIRPFDLSNVTDEGEQHFFVATLRYSPPELLFREEKQTLEAWRAVTFYQLGAVVHDLLMRKPLFSEVTEPYGRLVRAVEREIPIVNSPDADADLRLLAQNCLAKDPTHRLSTVEWSDFNRPKVTDPLESARRRIAQHRVASAQSESVNSQPPQDNFAIQNYEMRTAIHSCVIAAIKAEGLPRYSQEEVSTEDPYLFRVIFEPSPSDGSNHLLCFYCSGKVIDVSPESKELQFWACVASSRHAIPSRPDENAPTFTIKGALIDQDIRSGIQQRLLLAYAESLDSPSSSESASWLNIGGAL
jgi:serine/threonine protein kinase